MRRSALFSSGINSESPLADRGKARIGGGVQNDEDAGESNKTASRMDPRG